MYVNVYDVYYTIPSSPVKTLQLVNVVVRLWTWHLAVTTVNSYPNLCTGGEGTI